MSLSTHYYVISLGAKTNNLFEAFRDYLIEVDNHGFPVVIPVRPDNSFDKAQLHKLARTVDECFNHYYRLEPLRLIVVGEREIQSAFSSVTAHGTAIIGRVEGDHTATPTRDLGQIVWPIVKEAMSGLLDKSMLDLKVCAKRGQIASGLESVARLVKKKVRATLLVEDGYHFRGSIGKTDLSTIISPEVDVREVIDDAVDAVIEKVLESGGNVVFTPGGSLSDQNRIVLLLHVAAGM